VKLCKILMGPISGNTGQLHFEGEEIILDTATAELFERFGFVTILGDAVEGSVLSAKSAPPKEETEEEVKTTSKRKRAVAGDLGESGFEAGS
jgi:hypothetical protein